jgi:hypothetical protein
MGKLRTKNRNPSGTRYSRQYRTFEAHRLCCHRILNRLLRTLQNLLPKPTPVKIATIINFCSNDRRFISACIREAALFSEQILVVCSDHFFDGQPEDLHALDQVAKENPLARFLRFPYQKNAGKEAQYWVTYARWFGLQRVDPNQTYVLFLDADEIVDGKRFHHWLNTFPAGKYNAIKPANYYYFREPEFQAEDWEDSVLLIRKNLLTYPMVMQFADRQSPYDQVPEPKIRQVTDHAGLPMVHHYSWVRSEDEMLRKVKSWGHHHEHDWESLVRKEFSGPFQGTDFIHGYRYKKVPSFLDQS